LKIQELNVYLVLSNEGRLLLLKREDGFWEFPGGGVGWGERPEDASVRETKEETGLTPDNVSFLAITSATYEKGGDEKHSIYIVYKGNARGSDVRLSREHSEFRWVMPHEAKYMKLGLNAEPVLELL
jgi:ADP-ribose pyrophosphatase YjhB (NUDIX family)